MKKNSAQFYFPILIVLMLSCTALAGEGIVSSMKIVPAHMNYQGYHIIPTGTTTTPGDPGQTQLFEFKSPSWEAVTIGRLYTSCTCIKLSAPKKKYVAGEPVRLTLRNVLPTPGQTYALYVQITKPVRTTIRYDTYVISDSYIVPEQPVELEQEAD